MKKKLDWIIMLLLLGIIWFLALNKCDADVKIEPWKEADALEKKLDSLLEVCERVEIIQNWQKQQLGLE